MAEILSLPTALQDARTLSNERRDAIADLLREVRLYQKRAKTPPSKIAYAELENELLEVLKRWEGAGLINGQIEFPLAAEAPSRR